MRNKDRPKKRRKNYNGRKVSSYTCEESKQGGIVNFEAGLQGFPLAVDLVSHLGLYGRARQLNQLSKINCPTHL